MTSQLLPILPVIVTTVAIAIVARSSSALHEESEAVLVPVKIRDER